MSLDGAKESTLPWQERIEKLKEEIRGLPHVGVSRVFDRVLVELLTAAGVDEDGDESESRSRSDYFLEPDNFYYARALVEMFEERGFTTLARCLDACCPEGASEFYLSSLVASSMQEIGRAANGIQADTRTYPTSIDAHRGRN